MAAAAASHDRGPHRGPHHSAWAGGEPRRGTPRRPPRRPAPQRNASRRPPWAPLGPRCGGPVRSQGRGGAGRAWISIRGGARGAPPSLRLRRSARFRFRASRSSTVSEWARPRGSNGPEPQGLRTAVYPRRPHTLRGDLRAGRGPCVPRAPTTPVPLSTPSQSLPNPSSNLGFLPWRPRPLLCICVLFCIKPRLLFWRGYLYSPQLVGAVGLKPCTTCEVFPG